MELELGEVLDCLTDRGAVEWDLARERAMNARLRVALKAQHERIAELEAEGRPAPMGDG